MRCAAILLATFALAGEDAGYLEPSACAGCHSDIARRYARTAMGRSFSRPTASNTVEGAWFHEPSGQHYRMHWRDGRYYQRRHQVDAAGGERNVVEKEIAYVLGSGNHARTYLFRTPSGQLGEAPLGWYAEDGGHLGMNPGYDRPDHQDFRRKIDSECFFCHNAYPRGEAGARRELILRDSVPEGIDCQRCHGPGRDHVARARASAGTAAIRAAIVNPARLPQARRLEVCLQCHLESTSRRLPYTIRRYGRGWFSYRPGEPLERYVLHFDHPPGAGYDDKFEIAGAAYRLMKSACFGGGAMTCTTCHDPHDRAAAKSYNQACLRCHTGAHRKSEDCAGCHMPKRRTEDVVHVVMTDHWIQRAPAEGLIAPRKETHDTPETVYRGDVALLYPRSLGPEDELYLAAAQVAEGANLAAGIPRLRRAIETMRPPQSGFYLELAKAYSRAKQDAQAIPLFEEALRRDTDDGEARVHYGAALEAVGRLADAVKVLERAKDAAGLNALGEAQIRSGRYGGAVTALGRAARLDPDLPEIQVNLGIALFRSHDSAAAIRAFENAIAVAPGLAAAHVNLAAVYEAQGNLDQARSHFEQAIRSQPGDAAAHYGYGRALAARKQSGQARVEFETALRLDPQFAEAAVSLGLLLAQSGDVDRAIELYRRALERKPGLTVAHFNLALALLSKGLRAEARSHFEAVIRADPNDGAAYRYLGEIALAEGDSAAAERFFRLAKRPR